jgi:multisubunit Na+/H+ antiporter MnhG subunit
MELAVMNLLIWVGRIAGLLGLLLGTTAVAARLMGLWRIGDLQVGTLLLASVASMALGALAYSASVAERDRR